MARKVSRTSVVCGGERGGEVESAVAAPEVLRDLCDGGGVDARVLANVERLQMQAVGADLEQQRIDSIARQAAAVVADEAVAQDGEVGDQFGGARVWRERGVRRAAGRRCAAVPPRRIMMQPTSRRADS